MSSALLALGQALAHFAITQPREDDGYEGVQYRYGRLVLRPALYKYDALALAGVIVYLVWHFAGKARNRAKAHAWYAAVSPTLQAQFSLLKPALTDKRTLVEDGDAFLAYASGHKGLVGLHSTISLIPRGDPLALISQFGRPLFDVTSDAPVDTVRLDATLLPAGQTTLRMTKSGVDIQGESAIEGKGLPTGTWAVLNKRGLNATRSGRWDLSFPTLVSDNAKVVSPELAIMSEHGDITTALLAPLSSGGSGLRELLDDAEARSILRSIIISDLPISRPKRMPTTPSPLHITITTLLPPTPALAQAYLSVLLNLAALLSPPSSSSSSVHPIILRGEVSRKLRAARVDAWKDLAQDQVKAKEEAEREEGGGLTVKEKELKEKKEAKRAGLSKDELKKIEEREKKKKEKKQQMRMLKK